MYYIQVKVLNTHTKLKKQNTENEYMPQLNLAVPVFIASYLQSIPHNRKLLNHFIYKNFENFTIKYVST